MAGLAGALAKKTSTGNLGFGQAIQLKKLAQNVANKPLQVDEDHWKKCVVDLQKVMKLCHSVYLILEQNNEAMLRVAAEIVLCRQSRKMLWWPDSWFDDDDKREHFKTTVHDKLRVTLSAINNTPIEVTHKDESQVAELASLKKRLADTEATLHSVEQQKQLVDTRLSAMKEEAEEMHKKAALLEKNKDAGRRNVGNPGAEQELKQKLADQEKLVKELKEKSDVAGLVQKDLTKQLEQAQAESDAKEGELTALKEKIAHMVDGSSADALAAQMQAAEEAKTKAEQERQKALAAAAAQRGGSPKRGPVGVPEEEVARIVDAAAAKEKELARQIAEHKERYAALETEAEETRRELQAAREEIEELKKGVAARPRQEQQRPSQVLTVADSAAAKRWEREAKASEERAKEAQAALEETMNKLERVQAKLHHQEEQMTILAEEKAHNEAQLNKMSRMLSKLREQVDKLKEIAQRRGVGTLVEEILGEAGVKDTVESKEFSCFARLYSDALRRMEKQRNFEGTRFGEKSRGPQGQAALARQALAAQPTASAVGFNNDARFVMDPGPGGMFDAGPPSPNLRPPDMRSGAGGYYATWDAPGSMYYPSGSGSREPSLERRARDPSLQRVATSSAVTIEQAAALWYQSQGLMSPSLDRPFLNASLSLPRLNRSKGALVAAHHAVRGGGFVEAFSHHSQLGELRHHSQWDDPLGPPGLRGEDRLKHTLKPLHSTLGQSGRLRQMAPADLPRGLNLGLAETSPSLFQGNSSSRQQLLSRGAVRAADYRSPSPTQRSLSPKGDRAAQPVPGAIPFGELSMNSPTSPLQSKGFGATVELPPSLQQLVDRQGPSPSKDGTSLAATMPPTVSMSEHSLEPPSPPQVGAPRVPGTGPGLGRMKGHMLHSPPPPEPSAKPSAQPPVWVTARQEPGTALGLPVSLSRADAMRGRPLDSSRGGAASQANASGDMASTIRGDLGLPMVVGSKTATSFFPAPSAVQAPDGAGRSRRGGSPSHGSSASPQVRSEVRSPDQAEDRPSTEDRSATVDVLRDAISGS